MKLKAPNGLDPWVVVYYLVVTQILLVGLTIYQIRQGC